MDLTIHNRTLLRSWLASAVLFAAVSACSRSDRAETGSSQDQAGTATTTVDTAAVADAQAPAADTAVSHADSNIERRPVAQGTPEKNAQPSVSTAAPDSEISGYRSMGQDTVTASSTDSTATEIAGAAGQVAGDSGEGAGNSVVVGDSAEVGKAAERMESTETSQQANADTLIDQTDSEPVRPPEDSTETLGSVTTSVDTSTQVADPSIQVAADTGAAIQAQVDTTTTDQQTEVAVQTSADTAIAVGDSAEVGKTGERLKANQASEANADTLATETDRVRPPEDSTEVLGNVTTEQDQVNEVEAEVAPDQAPAAAAGAQTSGEMVTGAAAVAQLTREGQRCTVVEGEESEDMAGSPATMNPCGTGTMTLPRIQTEK